jgi:hypothetical protein
MISTQKGFIEKFDPNIVLAIFIKIKYIAICALVFLKKGLFGW